jgi:hypothetical protein
VLDSLGKAGTLPAPVIARIRTALASGELGTLFRRGGGGGGARGEWNARPGEGTLTPAPGTRAQRPDTAAGRGGEEVDVAAALESFPGGFRELQELFRPPGTNIASQFGGFGGGGGGGAPTADTGDYLVTLVVGGKEYKQLLRVVHVEGGADSGGRFEEEEEEGDR